MNEWQHEDPETGLVFPWYTKSFLDVLKKWDLSDKIVFEFGMGLSSNWWFVKCKSLYGVESNPEWQHDCGELETDPQKYPLSILEYQFKFDIIIIDGIERDKCVAPALSRLKKGGILICDNWDQPSVDETIKEHKDQLLAFEHYIYPQEGHPDWKTAYFII